MSNFEEVTTALNKFPPFWERVGQCFRTEEQLETLQMNIGLKCNLACRHCHLECSPKRTEEMSRETIEECLEVYKKYGFSTIDITGGAPELNPNYEWLLREAASTGARVMTRSNLTVCLEEGFTNLPELWAELGIVVVASLPHYIKKTTDKQRGQGTFDGTIQVLQKLNSLGYGKKCATSQNEKPLELDLVFNPSGAVLPPDQAALEVEYKQHLKEQFGIGFSNLFAITNCPGGRWGKRLIDTGNMQGYMEKLIDAFNPETVPSMMCRTQLSVGWDGRLYDCDFNQALDLPCKDGYTISDLAQSDHNSLQREIMFGNHCYCCTAGSGSS